MTEAGKRRGDTGRQRAGRTVPFSSWRLLGSRDSFTNPADGFPKRTGRDSFIIHQDYITQTVYMYKKTKRKTHQQCILEPLTASSRSSLCCNGHFLRLWYVSMPQLLFLFRHLVKIPFRKSGPWSAEVYFLDVLSMAVVMAQGPILIKHCYWSRSFWSESECN